MHKTRFIEIFLAHRDAKTGKLVAECYNTMFTPRGIPASKDTAPQAKVEGLDFEAMKKDFAVAGASLNGPKLWLSDWTEIEAGVERNFNGIAASWVARLNMGDNAGAAALQFTRLDEHTTTPAMQVAMLLPQIAYSQRLGDHTHALALAEQCWELLREFGHAYAQAQSLVVLGHARAALGEHLDDAAAHGAAAGDTGGEVAAGDVEHEGTVI